MKRAIQIASLCVLSLLFLSACQFPNIKSKSESSKNTGAVNSFAINSGNIITDNQQSFKTKLTLIDQAKESIDLAYFIVSDDYSSSVFASHLIAASQRGVKVRLLVDYVTNYSRLDWFSMLEAEGGGNLTVRFYGRPTNNMIKDAVYMTLGCSELVPREDKSICSQEKLEKIEALFQVEEIKGVSAESLNISNLNLAESGLFLSGFYGKSIDAMTLAIERGKKVSLRQILISGNSANSKKIKRLRRLGKSYWKLHTDSVYKSIFNQIKTVFALNHYGDALNPAYASFAQFLPAERQNTDESARDWSFLTDHTHHNLLLVDNQSFMLGSRSIKDSYHMHPNALNAMDTFMDTDVAIHLPKPSRKMQHDFKQLWSFITTASLAEVRQHAPNDFIANWYWANEVCDESIQIKGCRSDWLNRVNLSVEKRIALEKNKLEEQQLIYQTEYQPSSEFAKRFPMFSVSNQALGTYLENVSYHADETNQQRQFGAQYNQEAKSNKNIHRYWLSKLKSQCTSKDKSPKEIYFYNAYFSPPPNMILAFKALIDGVQDCSHVTLNIITNSVDTTNSVPVNIVASHSMKAFVDYYIQHFDEKRSAMVRYFEYQKPEGETFSLHSKVTLFEDALVIGSANVDTRSYFMDTNNALVIHNDLELIKQYQQYLIKRINQPDLLKLKNIELYNMTLEKMVKNDRQLLPSFLEKYSEQNKLSEAQYQSLIQEMEQLTTAAYQLTKRLLEADSESKQKMISERFYQLFKTI